MPTGYTHDVQNGKITEFRDFAERCARAMGVAILMRDDPMDKRIPDAFEVDGYHSKAATKANAELIDLMGLSVEECKRHADEQRESRIAEREESRKRRDAERSRYEAMLAKVEAWEPPSEEHQNFKKFMRDQLTESIRFDCGDYDMSYPPEQTGEEWRADRAESIRSTIAYHENGHAEEVQRTKDRNEWVRLMRESLNETVTA
jgi:hypothetical protein